MFSHACLKDTAAVERHLLYSSSSRSLPSSVLLCALHQVSKFIVLFFSVEIHFWHFPFFPFMLLSYVTSISAVSARTLSPQCPGSPSGTHAFKHVCLDLCQCLVGETKFACSSVSPWDTVYISMSNRPGRGKRHPLRARP